MAVPVLVGDGKYCLTVDVVDVDVAKRSNAFSHIIFLLLLLILFLDHKKISTIYDWVWACARTHNALDNN